MPLLSILVTSRNAPELLRRNLEAVLKRTRVSNEIIVCDDSDDTWQVHAALPRYMRERILWLAAMDGRRGFAENANRGLQRIRGYFVTCPPLAEDVEVTEGWDTAAIRFLTDNPYVGQMSFNVMAGRPGVTPNLGGYLYRDIPALAFMPCDYVGKGMTTRGVIEQVGYYSQEFPFYGADVDYSFRIRETGLICLGCKDSRIIHHHDERNVDKVDKNHRKALRRKWGKDKCCDYNLESFAASSKMYRASKGRSPFG